MVFILRWYFQLVKSFGKRQLAYNYNSEFHNYQHDESRTDEELRNNSIFLTNY